MTWHLVVMLTISILIAGCIPPPVATFVPCDEILHPAMLSVPFEELAKGQQATEEWILTQFPTATVEFDSYGTGPGDVGRFYWSEGDKGFTLHLYSTYHYIDQQELSAKRPELGQILQCYGDPEYYTLQVHTPIGGSMLGTRLWLWYPVLGVRFETASPGRPADHIDADYPIIGRTTIVPPGTVEEMLRNGIPYGEEFIQEQLALLQEWPENFTEFEVEE
jgi:hypothetical protein